jgi:hypothetical protein
MTTNGFDKDEPVQITGEGDSSLVAIPSDCYFLLRLAESGAYSGYYPGIAPVFPNGETEVIVQQSLPAVSQFALCDFKHALGSFLYLKYCTALPLGQSQMSYVSGSASRAMVLLPDNLSSTTYIQVVPKEALATKPDGDLIIESNILSREVLMAIDPPGPGSDFGVKLLPPGQTSPPYSTWRLQRGSWKVQISKSYSLDFPKSTDVKVFTKSATEMHVFAIGAAGNKICEVVKGNSSFNPPTITQPGFGNGKEVALATNTVGLFALDSDGAIKLYPNAPSTDGSSTITTGDQAFSAIAAWSTDPKLYAIDPSTNEVWQYDNSAPVGLKWTNVSGGLLTTSIAVASNGAVYAISMGGGGAKKGDIWQLGKPSGLPENVKLNPNVKVPAIRLTTTASLLVAEFTGNIAYAYQGSSPGTWTNVTTPQDRPWGGVISLAHNGGSELVAMASDGMDISTYQTNQTPAWKTSVRLSETCTAQVLYGKFASLDGYLFASDTGDLYWNNPDIEE